MPLFASPLVIAMSATLVAKLKGSSSLLTSCRGYGERNINKIMELITQAWETSQSMASLGTRAHDLRKHLQADLKNEESFYIDMVIPFGVHVNNMTFSSSSSHMLIRFFSLKSITRIIGSLIFSKSLRLDMYIFQDICLQWQKISS
jgi:hypothetical protein